MQEVDDVRLVRHALAEPAVHYTKREHVFQLTLADGNQWLLEAP